MKEYETTLASLTTDKDKQDAELSNLRSKVNTLTTNINKLRKELEFKGQEVLMVRRETNAIMQ